MSDDCIFCKIVKGDIPCFKIAETEKALAYMDIFPTSDGHCLIIPKMHAAKLHEIPSDVMADIGALMPKVAKAVGAENYNLLQNNGELAHQAVFHAHFHIIPKTCKEDGLGVGWPSQKGDMDKIKKLAEEISGRMAAL
eukprot:NODE_12272_length_517_cov_54.116751_g11983_i0.p1 GENE.NODE_12272_length_517_cov_54.116751_g11983_i0~~NODE_12272_length_517_cov_54.116751_g11983_i0.p1  ORF type:complete len:138 (-),score=41.99 NODE_12272_length_517_cov_54.116751_g11983_i0:51-464(-)